jgi:aminopeptidase N
MPTEPSSFSGWEIPHFDLRIELAHSEVLVESTFVARRVFDTDEPLRLHGVNLDVRSLRIDDEPLDTVAHERDDTSLTVMLGDRTETIVRSTVLVRPGGPSDLGFCSQRRLINTHLEPEGFRRITFAIDRPQSRATFDVILVGDPVEFPTMLANGARIDDGTLPDGRVWARFRDPVPKPTYLFAVVAGELAEQRLTHRSAGGRRVELRAVAHPELVDGAAYALELLADVMRWDERAGGLPYDLDELVLAAVPGYPDATEYHGLMIFEPSTLLLAPASFTDDDVLPVLANVSHEYFHHTRGNRVTVAGWDQLALKEGLTVLAQNDYREHLDGPVGRIAAVAFLQRVQYPEEFTIGAPVLRIPPVNAASMYTRTTYLKGAEVFRMLRTAVGGDAWADAFASFVHRFDLSAASVHDFVQSLREAAPDRADEIASISNWFTIRGRPSLEMDVTHHDGEVCIEIARTDSIGENPPVGIPISLGFLSADGAPAPVAADDGTTAHEHAAVLTGPAMTLRYQTSEATIVSPWRGYCAPVDLTHHLPSDHLAVIVRHDSDAYARWAASDQLMLRVISSHRALDSTAAIDHRDHLVHALQALIDTENDQSLLAHLLTLPDEHALGDRDERIDVDGVHGAVDGLRVGLAQALAPSLRRLVDRLIDDPTSTDPADRATRQLFDVSISYLLETDDPADWDLIATTVRSTNRTRAVRALAQAANHDNVLVDELIAETRGRWDSSAKLIDKWIRAQSGSRQRRTLERVREIVASDLYDRTDRSRVMAVWFPFCTRNRAVFHDHSGDGYRLFVDEVATLSEVNPELVLRLVGDFLQFRRFDDHRQALMRAQLERLRSMHGLGPWALGKLDQLLATP